jgi:hypothetical protein
MKVFWLKVYEFFAHYSTTFMFIFIAVGVRVGLLVKAEKLSKWKLLVDTCVAIAIGFGVFIILEPFSIPPRVNNVISCSCALIGQNILDFCFANDSNILNRIINLIFDRFKKK